MSAGRCEIIVTPNTPDAALLYQAAHRSQAELMSFAFHHLGSEGIGLIYIEVESGAVDYAAARSRNRT